VFSFGILLSVVSCEFVMRAYMSLWQFFESVKMGVVCCLRCVAVLMFFSMCVMSQ